MFIGSPENVINALKDHSNKIDGKSKEEYDAVLPNIVGIVEQNYCTAYPATISVSANGHANDGYSSCNVTVSQLAGQIV